MTASRVTATVDVRSARYTALMARAKTHVTCQACGYQTRTGLGKCPDRGGWGSLVEELEPARSDARPAWGASGGAAQPVLLKDVATVAEARRKTGIGELDRVLGGGVV